ncbi:MAG: hypothetical protein PVI90_10590 [Desulfobacteraceae bacterium]|jgi:hemerythrin
MDFTQWNDCKNSEPTAVNSEAFHQLQKKNQQLREAILQKKCSKQIVILIKELKYQAVLYFSQKEKQMLTEKNATYHHYRQAHDRFIWKITDLQTEYTSEHHPQVLALCTELQKLLCESGVSPRSQNYKDLFCTGNHGPSISH